MEYEYALLKGTILRHRSALGKESVYTIEKVLGQGGFGITYLASSTISVGNTEHKIHFAIKEFFIKDQCWREYSGDKSKEGLFSRLMSFFVRKNSNINENEYVMKYSPAAKFDVEECLRDFIEEASRLKIICRENENIVKVNEIFEANGTAYYVMEFLNGGSLRDKVLQKGTSLDELEAISLIIPIAKAVAHIHSDYKLLHCDISPDNIMLRNNENGSDTPVLIDFGESLHFNSRGDLTTTHNSVGAKEGYAPQEQYRGIKNFDPRIDVYALGATLFYLLTGKRPVSAFDISREYIEKYLYQNISDQVRDAIHNAMAKDKENRTKDARSFILAITGNDIVKSELESITRSELPIGYILKDKSRAYEIVSVIHSESYYFRYKSLQTEEGKPSTSGQTRRAQYDIYELFDQQRNRRQEDETVVADGDISASRKLFLSLCKKITRGEINGDFREDSNLGWATFALNNTFYLVDTHYRRPLPWKKILSYVGTGIGSVLLVVGAINIYNSIKEASIKKGFEMSQRLTHAIINNSADSLRIFAEDYDSVRAYLPYAKICLDNGDVETAKIFVEKAEKYSPQDSMAFLSLYVAIHEKESLILQQNEMATKEHIFDSLYNVAKKQYDAKQFLLAKETINKMDSDFLSRQQVIDLLKSINTFINSDEKESTFKDLLKLAESQYNNNLLKEAKATIDKMDYEHRSRREVTILLKKIESGLKAQELEKQYSEYLSKAQTAYKANRINDALGYIKKIQSMGTDYYSRLPVKVLMDDISSKIDPASILKEAEKKGQWDTVRELALSGHLPACGSLAKHYLKTGDSDAHCRAYYWAKKSSIVDREYVLGMLKSYGFLKDDGTPVVECNNIKY